MLKRLLGDFELNAVHNATADVLHVPRELEVTVTIWESLNAKAELACMHRDGHCHEAMKWYIHHLPRPMKTLTLCESKADPRWKRVTEGRRPKDRSEKGGSLISPGLATQRDSFLTAKAGYDCLTNATEEIRPDAVGWAPLVGQAR